MPKPKADDDERKKTTGPSLRQRKPCRAPTQGLMHEMPP